MPGYVPDPQVKATQARKKGGERMEKRAKHVYESKTTQIQILMPRHINGYNRLFGGKLVEWIDVVAAVTARRHSGCNVTTASIDNLQFQSGAYANSTIVIEGQLTWVGRTSMEVRVDTFVEELDGKKTHINRAYLIMVALDENENPTQVPGLLCDTEEEKEEFEAGKRRASLRKERRRKNY